MKILTLITLLFITPVQATEDVPFTGWMTQADLDSYFKILNNGQKNTSYFDQGKRITAVEGRWKNDVVQYRVKIGDTPKSNINWWFWWVNQNHDSFVKKMLEYEKDKFQLIYAQSFIMPDGTSRYQGVWFKTKAKNKTRITK